MGFAAPVAAGALKVAGAGAQVAGAIGQGSAANREAAALAEQAALTRRVGAENARILMERHNTARENERHSYFLGKFAHDQMVYQANVNRKIAEVQHSWERKFANLRYEYAQAQAKGLEVQADRVESFSREDRRRHVRRERAFRGRQRAAIAGSGVTAQGSPLEAMVEASRYLELERLDILEKSTKEAQDLRYAAELTKFGGLIDVLGTHAKSGINRFLADFETESAFQQAMITHADYVRQGHNWRNQALDFKDQATITMLEHEQASLGMVAKASGIRKLGRAQAISGTVGALTNLGKSL